MARTVFGATFAAWLIATVDGSAQYGAGVSVLVLPTAPVELAIYDAPDGGGSLVTDFLDAGGTPTASITVPANTPYIPKFSGPDLVTTLWVQAASGEWLQVPTFAQAAGGGSGDVQLAGNNSHEYADSQSPPWLILKRPNDNSDSSLWDNMLEIWYFDNSTSTYRLGFYINEKALLRVRGTTPSDVPARFMAHPSHGASTAVMEVTLDNNTVKVLQAFTSQLKLYVPIVVPYIVNPKGERLYWGSYDPSTDPAWAGHEPDVGSAWIDYNNPPA